MKRTQRGGPRGQLLAAYLEGEVDALQAAAIEAELVAYPDARRRLDGLREIRDALAVPVPEVANVDMVASVRRAIAAPTRAAMPRPILLGWRLLSVAAAAAGMAVILGLSVHASRTKSNAAREPAMLDTATPPSDEFRANRTPARARRRKAARKSRSIASPKRARRTGS